MGEKKKDFFSVETLVLRHRQEIASLTVSRLHVSHTSRVLCGFSVGLLIYRFEVRFPLNAQVLSLVNRVQTQTFFHYKPPRRPVMSEILLTGCQEVHHDTGAPLLGGLVDYQY